VPPTGRIEPREFPAPHPDDIAFIQHSAGTTGLQKGVALSHRAVLAQLRSLAPVLELCDTDRVVSWLPLYHDMGLIACFILPLAAHLPLVMVSPTDWVLWPGSLLRLASAHRCTLCWLPNFAFQFLARRVPERDRADLDLSSLRAVINCSEPVRTESLEEFARVYAPSGLARTALASSYAMAENTFAATQSAPGRFPPTLFVSRSVLAAGRVALVEPQDADVRPLTSSGRCLPGTDLRIVTEAGAPMPDGMVGHVILRSPSLFDGYYRRPDLTAGALRDGWYWTGDTGVVWSDEVYILGRHDDVIIVGGKNLYPQDLEEIVSAHPRIHDGRVVALGAFNPDLGTEDLVIVAEVHAEDDLGHAVEIQAEIRQQVLGQVGVAPRLVHLVPPKWIVKSTAGKPARAATRQKLVNERPELDRG